MPKNQILENITIDKLIFGGKGLATAPDGRKIIITGGCIPGSVVNVRVLKAKKSHYEGQQLDVVKKSPIEVPLPEGFQLYGGAKWLTIGYEDQLKIKEGQVKEAFFHLSEYTRDAVWHPIIASPELYGYRNKVEFSWGKYISDREGVHDEFRFGFHAQGQFDRIIDCTYCALADQEINDIFHDVDTFSRESGLPTYDPKTGVGFWRHFVVRKAKKTGEIMLVFSVNGVWDSPPEKGELEGVTQNKDSSKDSSHVTHPNPPLSRRGFQELFLDFIEQLSKKYQNIASIYFLENMGRADIVTGNPVLLFGKSSISDELLGLSFEIAPKSFFQVNTYGAEKLYTEAMNFIHHKGGVLLDLYAGTGTIGILLSKHFEKVYSVELVADASRDGEKNAERNNVKNVEFVNAKVEDFLKDWHTKIEQNPPAFQASPLHRGVTETTIVIDPPRDGMHPSTLPNILSFGAKEIIYVSCNPATLARDLEVLVGKVPKSSLRKELSEGNEDGGLVSGKSETPIPPSAKANTPLSQGGYPKYKITDITPVDMFPHTHHIETVVRLEKA